VAGTVGRAGSARTLQPGGWAWFGDFWFDTRQAAIQPADEEKLAGIVALLRREPSRCVAIDGTTRERGGDLGSRRIANLRDALLRAGIAAERIYTDDLGNPGLRHAERVAMLVGPAARALPDFRSGDPI